VSARTSYDHRTAKDLRIDIFGGVAVVRGAESVVMPDGSEQGLMRFTRIWVRRAGRYQRVAEQSTKSEGPFVVNVPHR
jgi:hypothetical protein